MNWQDVLNDPSLQDLPYKIELTKDGNIEMSPATNRHSGLQSMVMAFLARSMSGGRAFVEWSIDTPEGVKVADVVWCSPEFFAQNGYTTPSPRAPDLCVEVRSPSNSGRHLGEKIHLYLAQGAREVWVVSEQGIIDVYNAAGHLPASDLVAYLPTPEDLA